VVASFALTTLGAKLVLSGATDGEEMEATTDPTAFAAIVFEDGCGDDDDEDEDTAAAAADNDEDDDNNDADEVDACADGKSVRESELGSREEAATDKGDEELRMFCGTEGWLDDEAMTANELG
jgi:hypothetical protein